MNFNISRWKKDDRIVTMTKALLLALLPLLCCAVHCAAQGRSLGEVYLPASPWNDELFYFKQVEGIVRFGFPQGYFGFNESHALKLSFAAWSPVLVFPWVIWGRLFGWGLLSPVICNIFLTMLTCFLFVWLARPTWKQTSILTLLFCLYTPFVRYMLSGMPEVLCFDLLILFYGLTVNYLNREKPWKLALLLILSAVMTLMRPYLVLFLLLPMFLWIRKSRLKGLLGSAAVLLVTAGLYACIKHFLGAEYFTPLFFTDWVEAFFEQGIFGGLRFTLGKLYYMGRDFAHRTVEGFRTGLAAGTYFGGFLAAMAILLIQSFRDFLRFSRIRKAGGDGEDGRDGQAARLGRKLIVEAHLAFCFVAMLFALLLMYKLTEGSKHLLTFIAAGIFIISLMDTRFYKKAAVLGLTFAYLFLYKNTDAYEFQVPFVTEERRAEVQEWSGALEQEMVLSEEEVPSFENVVIWVFSDSTEEGVRLTDWQFLYGLPEGFGISCCMPEYVMENLEDLKSRYLFTPSDGEIDALCAEKGFREVWRDEKDVLYDLGTKTRQPGGGNL